MQNDPIMLLMFFFSFEYIRMSSMNTMTNLSNSGMNTEFIRYMKCVGALVSPNDITKYSYNPYQVEKAVLGMSSEWILIQ
jgi:hypothetical protein